MRRPRRLIAIALSSLLSIVGLSVPSLAMANGNAPTKPLNLVTTTPLLADIVRNVALPNATVTSLTPVGADPHTYEPTLRDVRSIVYADAVFSNHLLLEEQSLIRTIDANISPRAHHVHVAEKSTAYGGHLIQLVEDVSLDSVWLGMRVRDMRTTSTIAEQQRNRNQEVRVYGTGDHSAGQISNFLTGTFGQPTPYMTSHDGWGDADVVRLPTNAHTHMSWAFNKPGIYRLHLRAHLADNPDATDAPAVATSTITFAVGVDPSKVPGMKTVIRQGHMDVTVKLRDDGATFELFGDSQTQHGADASYDPATTVIEVPNTTLQEVASDPSYRFLGDAGDDIYVLAQAVLGKHMHGEIDPHVWQSVPNVIAMVNVIRDELISIDAANTSRYMQRAADYTATLEDVDAYVRRTIARVPADKRNLVTTHDAYGYLGDTYGLHVAGFVTPNPNVEPSTRDMVRLSRTLNGLHVPSVFIEPVFATHAKDLISAAKAQHKNVCVIYGDTFDDHVTTYVHMMTTNAFNISTCLNPSVPAPRFNPKGKVTK